MTSRNKGHWIIPKGWPVPGLDPHECAAREALEEAGLVGSIQPDAIGSFRHRKRLRSGGVADCTVEVFPLLVLSRRQRWLEQGERRTRWFSADAAEASVSGADLKAIIRTFARSKMSESF